MLGFAAWLARRLSLAVNRGHGVAARINRAYLRSKGIKLGAGVHVNQQASFTDDGMVTIGAGSSVSAAMFCTHSGHDLIASRKLGRYISTKRPIVVGIDCFIGWGAILLPGTVIGDNCIVGAGSVVRGTVPPGCVVIGNPARVVGPTADYMRKL